MKVLLLATGFPPAIGGVERFAQNIAMGLQEAGCSVRVLTTQASRLNRKFVKLLPMIASALRLSRGERPDHVVAMVWTHEGLTAALLRFLFGIPYTVVTHGTEILQYRDRPMYGSAMRFVLRHASMVVANSRFTRQLLVDAGVPSDRITVINPPVGAPAESADDIARVDEVDRFGLCGRLVLFTAARLVPRKGHADVIRVVARLKDRYPNLTYVMTGAGDYGDELSALAAQLDVADRCVMTGRVSECDLHALYRRADLYVSPSIEVDGDVEGFGMALAEAGAFGVPVVAGLSGGVTDVVDDGQTGVLVTPGNLDELTHVVDGLLANESRRRELGRCARARVLNQLNVARQGRQLTDCLARVSAPATSRLRLLLLLVMASLLVVLPRVVLDYGQSGDALDNARDAFKLVELGPIHAIPEMIRWPPGIPLFIWLLAGVVPWGGYVGANLVVFLSYVLALVLFAIAVRHEAQRGPLTVLFALTPFLLLNAAVTQDFMWGLAATLAAYVAVSSRAYRLTGILLGIGAAFRITNGLLIVPTAVYLWHAEPDVKVRTRALVRIALLSAVVGLVPYVPFILVSGLGWHYFVPLAGHGAPFGGAWMTALYNWLSVFGIVATAGMLAIAVLCRRQIAASIARDWSERNPAFLFSLTTIAIYLAVSFRFTMKAEYVMPAIPFAYLLFAKWFDRRQLIALTVLIASYGFFALDVKGGVPGHRVLTLKAAPGLLVDDWQRRREVRDLRAGIGELRSLRRAVVLTGMAGVLTAGNSVLEPASASDISPRLPLEAGLSEHRAVGTIVHRLRGTSVFLVTSMSRENVDVVRADGYPVYMFSEYAATAAVNGHHYDPYALRIRVLRVFGDDAFYRRQGPAGS